MGTLSEVIPVDLEAAEIVVQTHAKKGKIPKDHLGARLAAIDLEREKILQAIREWKEDVGEGWPTLDDNQVEALFCTKEEECKQAFIAEVQKDEEKRKNEEEIDSLFCNLESKCQEDIKFGKVQILPGNTVDPAIVRVEPKIVKKEEVTNQFEVNRMNLFQRIRKYLSERWQQRVI